MKRKRIASVCILATMIASSSRCAELQSQPALHTNAQQVCRIEASQIRESSGLALSQRLHDAIWLHNDSGDTARFFLVGIDGSTRGVFRLADTPPPVDWEDMCSFTLDGEPWLMFGDVGDNSSSRHFVTPDNGPDRACRLLLVREPIHNDGSDQDHVPVHATILFEYEDGPRNCESLAVDTDRKEILLVSKSKSTPLDCGMYTIPLSLEAGTTSAIARRIGSLDIRSATAMDVAPGNRRLVIISYAGATIVDRDGGEGWGDAIHRPWPLLALPRREGGETVCFDRSDDELLLNSEHVGQPLWRVKLPDFAAKAFPREDVPSQ
ncbi:MAG: hypothetical protein IT368_05515 [Candidatus Hydrogenedentes bacterium]|nr:hypothetical protein [Candidatus Hydrogenedentota bacterium]